MTSLTDTQVVTASGGLVELGYSEITSSVTVSSTSFSSPNLIISGPTVVCDGSPVMIEFSGRTYVAQDTIYFSLYRDGAELKRYWASRATGTGIANYETITVLFRDTPTAGSHTYSLYAHNASSTTNMVFVGVGSPNAFLRVSKIVQATQWPAVTTGTIICTSSTRPAGFEGQKIYETDTGRTYRWTGSVWLNPSASVEIITTTAQTAMPSGGWYALTFPSATVTNVDGFTVSGGDVTVPTGYGGMYAVSGQVQWDANTTGGRYLHFGGTGSPSTESYSITANTGYPVVAYQRQALSGVTRLAAGSTYKIWFYQDSGSNRSLFTTFMNSSFKLVRIGD